ncbi:DUF3572 domain-containing protein [Rhizobium sp. KVB221]|uniref:DUF3572 domain-containing protein n=2 Tax=Rhizobium setariae TaxID=2801340 RepID=A0A936YKI9_9HYPH|nr:DUF3572 domain-containing protein [Rhizobium setariae]MBL0371268.1 DUF3572 domain-containing protein [Rhizobium setariae]
MQGEADALAIVILTWLGSQPDLMGRFLALTGIDVSALRQAAQEPGFGGGLTGFLMNHEPTLMSFCADNDVTVEFVQSCHRLLTGPTEGVWL